jgi:4-amino-4-deoxy-L-arabinose transferase-like glycosyltransferase
MTFAWKREMNRNLVAALCIILLMALCVAPTLTWQEFSNSPENLVVATAQEMRRGGPWLVPTLQGELRWQKPPVTSWITAAAIRPSTMRQLSSSDRSTRHAAFDRLALEVRWPALLAGCLTLLGIYALGATLDDSRTGLVAVAVAGSSYFFLRFCRYATTDIYLTLFVTWTNVMLVRAVMRGVTWATYIGAGALLGAAIMTKGPVAIAQSVAPIGVFLAWRGRVETCRLRSGPFVAGIFTTLIVGLPWWLYVMSRIPDAANRLQAEMTGIGVADSPDPWHSYFLIIVYLMPWTIFFVVGLIQFGMALARRETGPRVLAGMLLIVPIVIMIFFKERHDRYLLPMLGPAAILIAMALCEVLRAGRNPKREDRVVTTLHWLMLGGGLAVVEVLAALRIVPMFASHTFQIAAACGLIFVLVGALSYIRSRNALLVVTVLIALGMQVILMRGFVASGTWRSETRPLADAVLDRYPDAVAYNGHPIPKRPPTDLGVYLNRQVTWIADPSALQAGDRPLVLFMLQNDGDPPPNAPAGWIHVERAAKRKDWWHAFVLPAVK